MATDEQFSDIVIFARRELKDHIGISVMAIRQPEQGLCVAMPNGEATRTILLKNYGIFEGETTTKSRGEVTRLIADLVKEIESLKAGIVDRRAPAWIEALGWMKVAGYMCLYRRDHHSGVSVARLSNGQYQVNDSKHASSFCLAAFEAISCAHKDFRAAILHRHEHSPRHSPEVAEEVKKFKDRIVALEQFYQFARANESP